MFQYVGTYCGEVVEKSKHCYIGLHILMTIKAMVSSVPTVAMKRGNLSIPQSHSCKIAFLSNPFATLRCIASSPLHSPLQTITRFRKDEMSLQRLDAVWRTLSGCFKPANETRKSGKREFCSAAA
jgi:hypothetical protein